MLLLDVRQDHLPILILGCAKINANSVDSLQNITLDTFGAKNAKLNGIYYLRDIADGNALNEGIANAKSKSKEVVIVGGGYIGMEVSSMLSPHGLNSAPSPLLCLLPRVLCASVEYCLHGLYLQK